MSKRTGYLEKMGIVWKSFKKTLAHENFEKIQLNRAPFFLKMRNLAFDIRSFYHP